MVNISIQDIYQGQQKEHKAQTKKRAFSELV